MKAQITKAQARQAIDNAVAQMTLNRATHQYLLDCIVVLCTPEVIPAQEVQEQSKVLPIAPDKKKK